MTTFPTASPDALERMPETGERTMEDHGVDPGRAVVRDARVPVHSPLRLSSDELSFGGREIGDDRPDDHGYLIWGRNDVDDEFTPSVSGYFHHTDAAGVRAGIQLTLSDRFGNRLSRRIERVPVVAEQGHHVSSAQVLFGDVGSPLVHQADVAIVIDVSDPLDPDTEVDWRWVTGTSLELYAPAPPVARFRILAGDFRLDGGDEQTDFATLTWNPGDNDFVPRVRGVLHATDAVGTDVLVRVRGEDVFGNPVDTHDSPVLEVDTNDHVSQTIDVGMMPDPRYFRIVVSILLEDDGDYLTVGEREFFA